MFTNLLYLNLMWAVGSAAIFSIRSKMLDKERIEKKYIFKFPMYKSNKAKSISEFFKTIATALLFLIPILNIGISIVSLFGNDEAFDKIFKEIKSIFCTVTENPEYIKDVEPKKIKEKNKFNLKNLLKCKKDKKLKPNKSKKLIDELQKKLEEEPKNETPKDETKPDKNEELPVDSNTKPNEEPKEETKPLVRTALQTERQLPFEITWEGSVYSGTSRTLKR